MAPLILIGVVVVGLGLYLSRQQQPTPTSISETAEPPPVSSPLTTEEITETTPSPPLSEQASEPKDGYRVHHRTRRYRNCLRSLYPQWQINQNPSNQKLHRFPKLPAPCLWNWKPPNSRGSWSNQTEKNQKRHFYGQSERTTWKAKKQFTLTLGNAGGVRVWLNGESRGPFGKQGQIVREVVIRD